MAAKPLIVATLIGATVGVPYLASHSPIGQKGAAPGAPVSAGAAAVQGAAGANWQTSTPAIGSVPVRAGAPAANFSTIPSAKFTSANQVIRFDVTKEWVYQNWDRKSTGPTDVGLFSVRVPLAMAPRMSALAGSLTYYFNAQGQVEHISFRGRTGDTTDLVRLVTTYYGLQRVEAPTGEQVYQSRYDGQVQSELRTRPDPILNSNLPFQSIAVELQLARPGSERVLPLRPTGFENIQAMNAAAAAAAASAPASQQASSSTSSASGTLLDKFRHATPQEESQVLWQRWPN
jgi:hypothetical protein